MNGTADAVVNLQGTAQVDEMINGMRRIEAEAKSMGLSVRDYMKIVGTSSKEAADAAVSHSEKHAMSYRTINKAAGEGARGVNGAMMAINTGALSAADGMDVFRVAMGAAFHGPETLAIVAVAAAVGFVITQLKAAKEAAHDVKWFGDDEEVTERYEKLSAQVAHLNEAQKTASRRIGGLDVLNAELAQSKKLNDIILQRRDVEKQIADIEADKIRMAAANDLKIAQAGEDPIKKMRAENAAKLEEKDREHQQMALKLRDIELQEATINEQLKVKGITKEQEQEEKSNKAKLQKLKEQFEKEKAAYIAQGDALGDIEKANGIRIGTEKTKIAAEQNAKALKFSEAMKADFEKGEKAKEDQLKKENEFYLKYVLEPKQKADKKALEDAKKIADEKIKLDEKTLGAQAQFAHAMGGFIEQIAGDSKAGFLIKQAFAAADIAFSTAKGYMAAVAEFPMTGGMPFAGWVLATGAAEEAAVMAQTVQGFARGTGWAPPGLAWVGEHGPELVNFRGGESVSSAPESARMSGGITIHVNYSPTVHGGMTPAAEKRVISGFKDNLRATAREIEQIAARKVQA